MAPPKLNKSYYICLEEERKYLKLAVAYSKGKAWKIFNKKCPAVPLGYLDAKTDEREKGKSGTWREAETFFVAFLCILHLYIQCSEVYSLTLDVLRLSLTPQEKIRGFRRR